MKGADRKSFYIVGATGFMGSGMVKYLNSIGQTVYTERIDVTDLVTLKNKFNELRPDVVINFAGVKAHPNIDWCEDHKQETVAVNVAGAINVMLASIESGAYPIQITSGCIYEGGVDKRFTEEDEPNFTGSFYSRMRIVLQKALEELPVLQVRIRMPVSSFPNSRNLINKIIGYDKVISVPNSVTLVEDMYEALFKLSQTKPIGILNLVNDGVLEHKQILSAYKKVVNPNHNYTEISLEELHGKGGITKAKRSNCLLSNEKAKSLGIEMPEIDSKKLEEIMQNFKNNSF